MKSFTVLFAMLAGGMFLGGCANTATFEAKDGHYVASGRSSHPEAMMETLSRNRARETNADAWAEAVKSGRAYPNQMGPNGAFSQLYRWNGVLIQGGPQQQMAPMAPPPAAPVAPTSAAPAAAPASQADVAAAKQAADEARKRADVALRVLQKMRTEGDEGTTAAQP